MSSSGIGQESSSCFLTLYDTVPYQLVAGLRVVMGLISLCCCLLLVIFFVYTKRQLVVLNQVLVFYLAIAALLHSLSYLVSRINFYTERPLIDKYCMFAGALELYTSWTECICVLCISVNLLAQVICKPRGKKLHWVYFAIIFFLPVLWSWIPFLLYAYGTSGPWCGIRTVDEDCQVFLFGVILRLLLVGLPILILFAATIFFSVTTWVLLKYRLHVHETTPHPLSRPVDKTQLLAELKLLLWYPPVYTLLQLGLLVNLAYDSISPRSPILVLWCLQVLTSPLAGAAVALVMVLTSEKKGWARVRSWVARHTHHHSEGPQGARPPSTHVSEYRCDVNVHGDSVEGMERQRRQERQNRSHLSPVAEIRE